MFTSPGDRSGRKSSALKYWRELFFGGPAAGVNSARPVSVWKPAAPARAAYADKDAAVEMDGSGNFMLRVPDGTSVGGNKGGLYCLDVQVMDRAGGVNGRNGASQVAIGQFSYLVSGYRNAMNETTTPNSIAYSGILGGNSCIMTSASGSGLNSCAIVSSNASVLISNGAVGSVVLGGSSGGISTGAVGAPYCLVLGGFQNFITAAGSYNVILGGRESQIAVATSSSVISGQQAGARTCQSMRAHGSTPNGSGQGVAQYERYVNNTQTSSATANQVVTQAAAGASGSNCPGSWPSGNGVVVGFTGTLVGKAGGAGAGVIEGIMWTYKGLLARDTTGAMYFIGTPTITLEGNSVAPAGTFVGATMSLALDNVNGNLQIRVSPSAATTSVWTAVTECAVRI